MRKYFKVGEGVPVSGVYEVIHSAHRLSHQATILAGYTFPSCRRCGKNLRFRLLEARSSAAAEVPFKNILRFSRQREAA